MDHVGEVAQHAVAQVLGVREAIVADSLPGVTAGGGGEGGFARRNRPAVDALRLQRVGFSAATRDTGGPTTGGSFHVGGRGRREVDTGIRVGRGKHHDVRVAEPFAHEIGNDRVDVERAPPVGAAAELEAEHVDDLAGVGQRVQEAGVRQVAAYTADAVRLQRRAGGVVAEGRCDDHVAVDARRPVGPPQRRGQLRSHLAAAAQDQHRAVDPRRRLGQRRRRLGHEPLQRAVVVDFGERHEAPRRCGRPILVRIRPPRHRRRRAVADGASARPFNRSRPAGARPRRAAGCTRAAARPPAPAPSPPPPAVRPASRRRGRRSR